MTRRILCPTDFSRNAQNAINYAIALFKNETCVFYILNTYHVEGYTMELTFTNGLEESKKKSLGGLQIVREWVTADKPTDHKFHTVSECGYLIDIMKTIVDKEGIDLVVMGTKGATDSRMDIYGSQTVLAMEEIRNCPVLAIPSKTTYTKIKEIVFPTDYRTTFKRQEFQYLVDIAKISKSSIKVLIVLPKDEIIDDHQINNQNLLKDYFEGLDYSFHTINDKDVQSAINAYIHSSDSDMVAFMNRRHSFFGMILSRPMVKNLGYYTTIPVLALHDFKR
ncbi:universal stress protein [Arenibacter sp. S6351L]|uniref:universal stress protein n=1 Tax=Arenibacter sp. S6351L TaxID=2926407 RepID=UPI001FF539BB|nr:universal stress protein [Arenibacter sp. S6351L]MCK0136155.1 universal stress protein [Arenibacter sp. S6351L]